MARGRGKDFWAAEAAKAAREVGHPDPAQFAAQMATESIDFDEDVIWGRRVSPAGAQGIAQFMPATAKSVGVNPLKPRKALRAAAKLMKGYIAEYGPEDALRAYNAGPGAIKASYGYGETNNYVNRIRSRRSEFKGLAAGAGPSRGGDMGATRTPGTPAQTVAGYKAQNMPAAAPASAAVQQLAAELAQGAAPVASVAAPALPAFAAAARGPQGQALSVPSVGAAAPAPRVADQLAQAAVTQGPTVQNPDVAPLRIPGTSGTKGGGRRGPVLVVGDSLGVGTAPLLKRAVGGKVEAVVKGGISSSRAVAAARDKIASGQYGTIVFDLGTNDASAKETVASLREVARLAPNARIVVATVNSPYDEGRKNKALRTIARNMPNVELVRWRGASKGGAILADGIHGAYDKRAALFAQAIGPAGGGGAGGGQRGKLTITGPNPGRIKPLVKSFGEEVAGVLGKPLVGSDGTGHSYRSATGNVSQHSVGEAVDIPLAGKTLLDAGRAALIAAGMPRAKAMKVKGGLFNLERKVNGRTVKHQVIFNDYALVSGTPHTDHLHISAAYA